MRQITKGIAYVLILIGVALQTVRAQSVKLVLENLNTPQPNVALNTGLNNFVARDLVTIKAPTNANLRTSIAPNSSSSAYLKTDHTLTPTLGTSGSGSGNDYLPNNSANSYTVNTALDLGYIPGSANVTPSGGASYSIPLDLPVGAKGMKPNLAVNYNSQNGNGLLGWGWQLSGISSIRRVSKDMYTNGEVSTLWNDSYALDGNKLVALSSSNPNVYRLQNENFSTITRTNDAVSQPDVFVVNYKDGSYKEYGRGNTKAIPVNGTNPTEWWISKTSDVNGNTIKYDYILEKGCLRINKIDYTSNDAAGGSAPYSILFFYSERSDKRMGLYPSSNGTLLSWESKVVLSKITITYNRNPISSYNFDYSIIGGITKLNAITQVAEDGTSKLNPTKVVWQNVSPQNVSVSLDGNVLGTAYTDVRRMLSGDITGDGMNDLVLLRKSSITILKGNFYLGQYSYTPITHSITYYTDYYEDGGSRDFLNFELFDVDNDGKQELVRFQLIGFYRYGSYGSMIQKTYDNKMKVYQYNQGTIQMIDATQQLGISLKESMQISTLSVSDFYSPVLVKGDYDGNGQLDFIVFNPFGGKNIGSYNFTLNNTADLSTCNSCQIAFSAIDKDGDGKSEITTALTNSDNDFTPYEIWTFNKDGSVTPSVSGLPLSYGFPAMYSDFNGDGITDALIQVYEGYLFKQKILFGNGSSFVEVNGWSNAFTLPNMSISARTGIYDYWKENTLRVSDVNYDGQMDLVSILYNSQTQKYSLRALVQNNGTFAESVSIDITSIYKLPDPGMSTYNRYSKGLSIWGDLNSDLTLDFLNIDNNGIINRFNLNFGYSNDLNSITDGLGRNYNFTYDIINGDPNTNMKYLWYTPPTSSATYPNSNFLGPLRVVTALEVPNGLGGINTTTYGYEGGTLNLKGKGFLGFSKFKVVDQANNIEYATEYQINTDYTVSVSRKTKSFLTYPTQGSYIPTRTTLSTEDYVTNTYIFPLSSRSFTYTKSVVSQDNMTGLKSTVTYDYDETLGDLKSIATVNSDQLNTTWDAKTTVENNWNYFGTNNAYRKIDYITTKKQKYGGSEFSQTTSFVYTTDGKNLLRVFDGTAASNLSKTEYSYTGDLFGNPTQITRHADDVPDDRIEKFSFDGNGINLVSNTLANGAIYSYQYASSNGLLAQSIAPGGLITEYNYDIWGKNIKTKYPDGTESVTINSWEITEPLARYKVEKRFTGSAPIIMYYDLWGRQVKSNSSAMNSPSSQDQIYIQKAYNTKSQLTGVSVPYTSGVTPKWINYSYDTYGRPVSIADRTNPTLGTALTTTFEYPSMPVSGRNFVKTGLPVSEDGSDRFNKTTYTSEGLINKYETPAGITTMQYHGSGQQTNVTNGMFTETYRYDDKGRLDIIGDPYKGTDTYTNNGFREQSGSQHTKPLAGTVVNSSLTRNVMGQVSLASIGDAWKLTYTFEPAGSPAAGQVSSISSTDVVNTSNNVVSSVKYDKLGRLSQKIETIKGKTYTETITYDQTTGKISTITYPNNLMITYTYHPLTGELYQISSNKLSQKGYLWRVMSQDASGKLLSPGAGYVRKTTMLGNGLYSIIKYDDNHNFANIETGPDATGDGVIDSRTFFYSATTHPNTGNIVARQSYKRSVVENFTYDNMGRIKEVWEQPSFGLPKERPRYTYTYDARGNVVGSTEKNVSNGVVISDYLLNYPTSVNPDQLQTVDQRPGVIPSQDQTITYTDFNKVSSIRENGYVLDFVYGPDQQRRIMTETGPSNYTKKTYYQGDYEFETDGNDNKLVERTYIWGPDGLIAVLINDPANGGEQMYYTHTDHLGSVLMLTNASGAVAEEYSYDAWGRRRNPSTWQYYNSANPQPNYKITRGFTFHEHLDRYGLINMNGRLYDPILGRFSGPDKFAMEFPDWSPYNYALNNPLTFNDPSGDFVNGNGNGNGSGSGSGGTTSNGTNYAFSGQSPPVTVGPGASSSGGSNYYTTAGNNGGFSFGFTSWYGNGFSQYVVDAYKRQQVAGRAIANENNYKAQAILADANAQKYAEATNTIKGSQTNEGFGDATANTSSKGDGQGSWIDNVQTGLDVAGIADPTGIVDGVNAFIYAGRGQWGNAGISALGIIPYIGDAGKATRLGSKTLNYLKMADKTHGTAATFNKTSSIHSKIMFNDVTQGFSKQVINTPKGPIIRANLGDGNFIQMRNFDRSGSHTTFDFINSNGLFYEFKFNR